MHRNSNTSRLELTNQNEINIVQASLLGSILANLLLILGMCFLIGGLRFREQVRRARELLLGADACRFTTAPLPRCPLVF